MLGRAASSSTEGSAVPYASVRHSPRWEHVRELATNPYFSIHQPALQRYASRQPPRFVENDEIGHHSHGQRAACGPSEDAARDVAAQLSTSVHCGRC